MGSVGSSQTASSDRLTFFLIFVAAWSDVLEMMGRTGWTSCLLTKHTSRILSPQDSDSQLCSACKESNQGTEGSELLSPLSRLVVPFVACWVVYCSRLGREGVDVILVSLFDQVITYLPTLGFRMKSQQKVKCRVCFHFSFVFRMNCPFMSSVFCGGN